MHKIIYHIYITCLFIIFLFSTGCKKMLEIPANAPGQLITGQVFSDSTTAVSGVVGMYISAFSSGSVLSQFMSLYPSLSSDDLTSFNPAEPFSSNALISGNDAQPDGTSGFIWNSFYNNSLIYQANAAIEGITSSTALSASLKDQLIGECEVIRALCYFYLVNLYGPVPVVTTTDYKVNGKLPRAATDNVYTQIISDLTDAINRLPTAYVSSGRARPNKYTAMALLSRVYLYREDWSKAQTAADAIITAGGYQLETLANVFAIGNQEAIWQAVSVGFFGYDTQTGFVFIPPMNNFVPQYYLTSNLLNTFEADDQRKIQWIASNNVDGADYYYPYKYKNREAVQVDGRIEGEVLFRLAEQYLIRAEARIRQDDLEGGAEDINMVRSRAGLENTPAATKEDLIDAVMHERRTEFFCEWGHRWLDLKRTNNINVAMTEAKGSVWPTDGHAALYPISTAQIRLNPGWEQNNGY